VIAELENDDKKVRGRKSPWRHLPTRDMSNEKPPGAPGGEV